MDKARPESEARWLLSVARGGALRVPVPGGRWVCRLLFGLACLLVAGSWARPRRPWLPGLARLPARGLAPPAPPRRSLGRVARPVPRARAAPPRAGGRPSLSSRRGAPPLPRPPGRRPLRPASAPGREPVCARACAPQPLSCEPVALRDLCLALPSDQRRCRPPPLRRSRVPAAPLEPLAQIAVFGRPWPPRRCSTFSRRPAQRVRCWPQSLPELSSSASALRRALAALPPFPRPPPSPLSSSPPPPPPPEPSVSHRGS